VSSARNRLLVLGGSGFIGRHIVARAVALGWSVTSIGLSGEREVALPGVTHVAADITDPVKLRVAMRTVSFEYVVNCSGYIDHTLLFQGGRQALETHFNGLMNIVDLLDRSVLTGFVNIGSSDEYGNLPAPQAEGLREIPISPYSMGKVAATHLLQMLYRTENFPATTLRLFLTYGPGQGGRRFLPQIISGCLQDKTFPVSAGAQLRDFCHVQDTVAAVFAALQSPVARGEVINIGSGKPLAIREMIELVQTLVGFGRPEYGVIPYRAGENMELYPDISKAQRLLGWRPAVELEAGLQETIRWVKEQL
jgi:nucleoside-diphosphate-sugar epimerase